MKILWLLHLKQNKETIKKKDWRTLQKNSKKIFIFLNIFANSPYYIVDGRIRYPIEDQLIQSYGQILPDCNNENYVSFSSFS